MQPVSAIMQLGIDGNQWCALIGPDLQEGIGGFGDTPAAALRHLADQIESSGYEIRPMSSDSCPRRS